MKVFVKSLHEIVSRREIENSNTKTLLYIICDF